MISDAIRRVGLRLEASVVVLIGRQLNDEHVRVIGMTMVPGLDRQSLLLLPRGDVQLLKTQFPKTITINGLGSSDLPRLTSTRHLLKELGIGQRAFLLGIFVGGEQRTELDILLGLGCILQQRTNVEDLGVLHVIGRLHGLCLHDRRCLNGRTMGHQQCHGKTAKKQRRCRQLEMRLIAEWRRD